MKKVITPLTMIAISITAFAQNTYTLDKDYARLSFSAVHLGISHVEGNFKTFDVTFISSKEDFSDAQIEMSADVNSINTEVTKRDADLRDFFFEANKFPKLTFKSTSFTKTDGKNYKLKGLITIHGITKSIEFDVAFNGKGQNSHTKNNSFGFTITGKLNRKDFDVGGDPLLTGVGNEIELTSNVEFIIS